MISMNNNAFLVGVVEDINDPLQMGRVRVRYVGIHTDNKSKIPSEMLPWSNVLGSIYSASISGVGMAPVGMVCGTMVFAIPLESGMQEFLVLGTLAGNRSLFVNPTLGFNDPNGEYPRAGVAGDINIKAGGNADSGTKFNISSDVISSVVPGAKDPTIPDKVLDPKSYMDTPWMPIAIGELGTNETDDADRIKEYQTIGGGLMRESTVAWCASFIGWCLDKVNIRGTRSAASRSYLKYGRSVGTTNIPYGSIAVFGVPNSGQGHIAFVVEDRGDELVCIGGNQVSNSGGIISKTNIPKNGSNLALLDCVLPTNLQSK